MKTLAIASLFCALSIPARAQTPILSDDFTGPDTIADVLDVPLSRDDLSWRVYGPNNSPINSVHIDRGYLSGAIPSGSTSSSLTWYVTPSSAFTDEYTGMVATFQFRAGNGSKAGAGVLLSSVAIGALGVGGLGTRAVHAISGPTLGVIDLYDPSVQGLASCTLTKGSGRLVQGAAGKPTVVYYKSPLPIGQDYSASLTRTDDAQIEVAWPDGSVIRCDDSRIANDWGQSMTIEAYSHDDDNSYAVYRSVTALGNKVAR